MINKNNKKTNLQSLGTRTICALVGPLRHRLALLPFKVIWCPPAKKKNRKGGRKKNSVAGPSASVYLERRGFCVAFRGSDCSQVQEHQQQHQTARNTLKMLLKIIPD